MVSSHSSSRTRSNRVITIPRIVWNKRATSEPPPTDPSLLFDRPRTDGRTLMYTYRRRSNTPPFPRWADELGLGNTPLPDPLVGVHLIRTPSQHHDRASATEGDRAPTRTGTASSTTSTRITVVSIQSEPKSVAPSEPDSALDSGHESYGWTSRTSTEVSNKSSVVS